MRVGVQTPACGSGMPTSAEQLGRPVAGPPPASAPRCSSQALGELPADGQHRVERGHRVLEDHADRARPRTPPQPRRGPAQQAPRRAGGRCRSTVRRRAAAARAAASIESRSCRCPTHRPPRASRPRRTSRSSPSTTWARPRRLPNDTAGRAPTAPASTGSVTSRAPAPRSRCAAGGRARRAARRRRRLNASTVRKIATPGKNADPPGLLDEAAALEQHPPPRGVGRLDRPARGTTAPPRTGSRTPG